MRQVTKRDGRHVPYDRERITGAIEKSLQSTSELDLDVVALTRGRTVPQDARELRRLAESVTDGVEAALSGRTPLGVEEIQDVVERELVRCDLVEAARHYITYRAEHAAQRRHRDVDAEVRGAFASASETFGDAFQEFMFFDKYSRYRHDLGRRETWPETVSRSVDYLRELARGALLPALPHLSTVDPDPWVAVSRVVERRDAMPSMRLLAMAGEAARRQNASIYNCTYLPLSDLLAFKEVLLLSMAGCGVGFSVEDRYVHQLPSVQRQRRGAAPLRHVVEDSTEGWGDALYLGLCAWFAGGDVDFDLSGVRRAGAVLRVKGGRASGPEPLRRMLATVRAIVLARQDRHLRPIDAHDIACAVGLAAVSGGMRRTAMIRRHT